MENVGPASEIGGEEFFDDSHITFAIVVVVGHIELGWADGEDVVGGFDERVADTADVFGGRGAYVVAEDFDLGLGFIGPCSVP